MVDNLVNAKITLGVEHEDNNSSNWIGPALSYYEIFFYDTKSKSATPLHEQCQFVSNIRFNNFFVAAVTIKQLSNSNSNRTLPPHWVTILKSKQLMKDPHSELEAYGQCNINFNNPCSSSCVIDKSLPIRIYLEQPSPMWKKIELRNIKLFFATSASRIEYKLPPPPKEASGGWVAGNAVSIRNHGSNDWRLSASATRSRSFSAGELANVNAIPNSISPNFNPNFNPNSNKGAILDKLCRQIKGQMAIIRGSETNLLQRNQAAAFLSINDPRSEAETESPI
ncbi:hypothetical protein ScalyP_jg6057 [Parmales sp. scaly parma]|nr:hypothetical protein ScalyP_jg6057 [Parmales sp. scaly parma]|tara:strand:- start:1234 stop:2076 length:843 start_codon:yes stop_codon:yes gene_type:complete